jgi:hypothetical protein
MNYYEQQLLDLCTLYPHHNGMMVSVVEEYKSNWRESSVQLHTLNHGVLTKQCRSKYYNKTKNRGIMTFSHLEILKRFINNNSNHRNGRLWNTIMNCVDGRYVSSYERAKKEMVDYFTFELGEYKTFTKCTTVPDVMIFSKLLQIFGKRVFGTDYSSCSKDSTPNSCSAN